MKKLCIALVVICLCAAVAASGASDISIDDVTDAIQTVDSSFAWDEEKHYFEMIGAKDGWAGYLEGTTPVKVYEYENQESYDEAVETFGEIMGDFPKSGNFVLECNDSAVTEAFESTGQ